MNGKITKFFALICLIAFFASENEAKAATSNATATATIAEEIGVGMVGVLDFGTIIPGATPGTVTIAPKPISRSSTGGVTVLNTSYGPALFKITGKKHQYNLAFPSNNYSITISNPDGNTMTVTNFSFDQRNGSFEKNNEASFLVGGRLNVAANQPTGVYTGTFVVNITYTN